MSAPVKTPAEILATPVQFLKGVGPQRAELLERLGLRTARDVVFFFPRDYQDLTQLDRVADLVEGNLTRLRGKVEEVDQRVSNSGNILLGVLLAAEQGRVRLLWYNSPFRRERFGLGEELLVTGKPKMNGGIWEFTHPQVQSIDVEEQGPAAVLLPVYPLTEGLTQGQMRKVAASVLETCLASLDEVFPASYLASRDLQPVREAIRLIHAPRDRAELEKARRRLIYQELLVLQLALAMKHDEQHSRRNAPPLEATAKIDARIRRLFPFELTGAQNQAIAEVNADMARPHPMNRLLQGDVGSGKTVVAVYAMLLAVAHGYQAVLMAPTEVLARQHAATLERTLAASHVEWRLLSGGISASQRTELLDKLATGEVHVVIGTQAILQPDVRFARLGLVVIDEQHKFGVRQRASLKQAGLDPHYLVMTATPIPRTVAMTLFGDLDVSTLREAPPGRQAVHTYLVGQEQREKWWDFFGRKLRDGKQGYVVTPLIDESSEADVASLEQAFESLAHGPLEAFRLGLLHGRMSSSEKEETMQAFRRGDIQALVTTTVVEVGIDVPNATLMTVYSGERFGLSQLHQLRGRVSRGVQPGYCAVLTDVEAAEARQRLEAFAATSDGFQLAEIDFELRGPGDLLGTRQHGLPPLRIANLARDGAVIEEARRDAQQLVAATTLSQPEFAQLRHRVLQRYGRVLELGDVG
ncbi:MAG TPA: ATP-dependent DNA helicase RecG [Pirellulales bacterium]|nr:ATP-dependent DNA helicase RecG [Pirellulales bacterium]